MVIVVMVFGYYTILNASLCCSARTLMVCARVRLVIEADSVILCVRLDTMELDVRRLV